MSTDPECLFCKIVAGEIPATIVRDDETTVAFRDINPQAPVHVLVVPRIHLPNAAALAGNPPLLADVINGAAEVAKQEGIAETGYRLVFNTGSGAGQTVFHVHAHVLGGKQLGWPP
jgi:histidine triad (HIT) family protein